MRALILKQQTNRNHSGSLRPLRVDPHLTYQMAHQATPTPRKRHFRAIPMAYYAGKAPVAPVHAIDIDRLGLGLGLKVLVSSYPLLHRRLQQVIPSVAVLAMKPTLPQHRNLRL